MSHLIVTLSGSQGVGKTTLLNEMKKDPRFKDFVFVDEIVRTLMNKGFKINEEGDENTQLAVMAEHLKNSNLHQSAVLDRCAIDGMAYTIYLHRRGKISDDTLNTVYGIFDECIKKYDVMFYIDPEFDIVPDGVRATSYEFRDEVTSIFNEIIKSKCLNVIRLSGSVNNRLETIICTLGDTYARKHTDEGFGIRTE